MSRPRVLCVGNTVLDVIGKSPEHLPKFGELAAGRGPADLDIGGNGARAAATASVLGADSALASAVGDDVWGEWLTDQLQQLGVDLAQMVTVPDEPTATTVSLVRPDGERALLTHNGASDHHDLGTVDVSGLSEGSWLLVGSLFLVPSYGGDGLRRLVEDSKELGAMVAMDLAWDCSGAWDLDLIPLDLADIVLGNELELKAVGCSLELDTALDRLMDRGVGTLVAKMGADGARIVRSEGGSVDVPAPQVEAINSTGTGDAFNAALVFALGRGMDIEEATRFACAAGALKVAGGCHTFPKVEEIEELLGKDS
jgi:ribokinase